MVLCIKQDYENRRKTNSRHLCFLFQKNKLKFIFYELPDIFMNYLILSGPGPDTKSYDLTRIFFAIFYCCSSTVFCLFPPPLPITPVFLTFFHKYKK